MSRSTVPSAAHVDQHPTIPPPARSSREPACPDPAPGPLGLVLNANLETLENVSRLGLASLLLNGLTDVESDPVGGILQEVSEDAWLLGWVLEKLPEAGDFTNVSRMMRSIARRANVAAELSRRLVAEAQEATRAIEEGGSR